MSGGLREMGRWGGYRSVEGGGRDGGREELYELGQPKNGQCFRKLYRHRFYRFGFEN